MLNSLRARLILGAAGFIAAALVLAWLGLALLFERHVKYRIDAELDAHLEQLIAGFDRDASGQLAVVREPADSRFEKPLSGLYWAVRLDSGQEQRSRSLWDGAIALPDDVGLNASSAHHTVAGPNKQQLYLIQRHVELPARLGRETARFAVALDKAEVDAAVWQFASALAPLLAVLGLLLTAAAWMQVTIGLRPLASVKSKIEAIRTGLARRLGTHFPSEVQPLAREIDHLLDARDKQIEIARQRAADLAHGLKTPLQVLAGGVTRLRNAGEGALAGDLESAAVMMQRHIDRQLARARLQTSNSGASANVRETVERVVRVLKHTPKGLSLEWPLQIPAHLKARIHPDDLSEALGGLVENAARFANSMVEITAAQDGGGICISVCDDGPGIPAEKFDEALKRGTRLDTAGGGSGLGLAITADIAEAWGGTLELENAAGLFKAQLRLASADSTRS